MVSDFNAYVNTWHTPQINNKYLCESECNIEQVGYYLYLHIHPRIFNLGHFFLANQHRPLTAFFLLGEPGGCKIIFIQAKENNYEMEISRVQIINIIQKQLLKI